MFAVGLGSFSAIIQVIENVSEINVAKRFVALARVSSREQEREGFSLDVQEDALRQYVDRVGGEIVKMFRIAETASKRDERKTFKELLVYAKKNAHRLDGLLFYKVDRAARNLFDYVELERLESSRAWHRLYLRLTAHGQHSSRPNATPNVGEHGVILHGAAVV